MNRNYAFFAIGIAFFAIGVSSGSTAFVGLGIAFAVIGMGVIARNRNNPPS